MGTCWAQFTNAGALVQQDRARIVGVATLASIQETTLDVVWIRDGVICFGNRPAERCYRALLTTEGPPEAFAVEADRVQPAVDAYASFRNRLPYPNCWRLPVHQHCGAGD